MRHLCVFCGSQTGDDPAIVDATTAVARALVGSDTTLVYGGGRVGLMGILADAVLEAGGRAVGVIPGGLAGREIAHAGLTELHVVGDMLERKALMAQLSDAFLALPGGLGTLDELFEMLTWSQLGIHDKPLGLLDVGGFWSGLRTQLDACRARGFVSGIDEHLLVDDDPGRLVERLAGWRPQPRQAIWRPAR
jgi:hypothetical protein